MLGDKALELIKQLQRCDYLNPLQDEVMKQVYEEMKALFEENQLDVNASISGEMQCHAAVQLRHAVLLRDKRCVLSYLFSRLQMIREIRWGFGAVLPYDVRSCLSEAEVNWFGSYNRMVANYMSSIGNAGVDLFMNLQPPKSLYVQVRCLCDYGDFETSEGSTVVLTKNSTLYKMVSESSPPSYDAHYQPPTAHGYENKAQPGYSAQPTVTQPTSCNCSTNGPRQTISDVEENFEEYTKEHTEEHTKEHTEEHIDTKDEKKITVERTHETEATGVRARLKTCLLYLCCCCCSPCLCMDALLHA